MEDTEKLEDELPQEPREKYTPRPRWQIALAWVMLAVMVFATASYYFWIAYRY